MLFITARAQMPDKMEELAASAAGYLTKPFRTHDLIKAAERLYPAQSLSGPANPHH
jgi:CheY-like chemotaxis protein